MDKGWDMCKTNRKEDLREKETDVQLEFGPGKGWMIARPRGKSRGDTQPSVTMYLVGRQ